jgi:FKBP-type peptidyl-prolyl cis-trans isomerase FkpA
MRHHIVPLAQAVLLVLAVSAQAVTLETADEKSLYALGANMAKQLGRFALTEKDLPYVEAGLRDGVLGNELQVDLATVGPQVQELMKTRGAALAAKEKESSQAFLDKAAKEDGAEKTESGLVYKSLTEGTGDSPTATSRVTVHYKGTLTDGTEFDSSYKRDKPATFPLNGVVKCWTEALQKMKKGGKARIVCPSDIAYGDAGRPPLIKPGATLVFEVELIEIES